MTADPPPVMVAATDVNEGCTGCGTQRTVILHPHQGRRCPTCMTLPPGPFRRDLAADIVELGRADAAFTYLAAYLAREIDARFAAASPLQVITPGRLTAGVITADVVIQLRRCWCGRPIPVDSISACGCCCTEHDDPAVLR